MNEVEICLDHDRYGMTRFGEVGGPPHREDGELCGMDPIILITPNIVSACFGEDGCEIAGILGHADRAGYLTLACPEGVWKYELFPARWSDDEPHNPAVYLAVWPD